MALYGPSLMQGLGGLIQGMGQGPISFGQGRIVDGGWPGRQAPRVRAVGSNALTDQVAAAMPDVFRMFAPPTNTKPSHLQAVWNRATAENLPMLMRYMGASPTTQYGTHTTAGVISPGQTQVVRPSQQPARRASAPQAGASSSLMTEVPSPAEVALATTSLLGG